MEPEIIRMLEKETPPENIERLLGDLKKWLAGSRSKMKKSYGRWDDNMKLYRSMRVPDESDIEARANDEPEKMTVPLSYTQVMTFATFSFMLFQQNPYFFMMEASGNEDYPLLETIQTIMERDLRRNSWSRQLFQTLIDAARFGMCAQKTTWRKDTRYVSVDVQPDPMMIENINVLAAVQKVQKSVIKYEGNELINISPYRILPDTRMPLVRWREGRFCADETEYHIQYLKELERQGQLVGCEYIEKLNADLYKEGAWDTGRFEEVEAGFSKGRAGSSGDEDDYMVISTEGLFKLVPSQYGLGSENYVCDFQIVLANNNRILKLEKLEQAHGEFLHDIGQFNPDVHQRLGMALVDPIAGIQDVITYLINSRVVSIRQGIERHLVIDPSVIDTTGLDARSPIIMLRKGAPRTGIQNFVQQLKYTDTTQSHFQDAGMMQDLLESVTGVNKNAMGQYAPGRRSAQENKAANTGASSRMIMHAQLLWTELYNPMGQKMLLNSRQGLSQESFQKVIGEVSPTPGQTVDTLYQLYAPGVEALIGNEDFFSFNGTTQSDRIYTATALQELVQAMMGNPEVIPMTGYDLTKLIDEIQYYRGIRNVNRFKVTALQTAAGIPGQGAVDPVTGVPIVQSQIAGIPLGAAGAGGGLPVGGGGLAGESA